MIPCPTPLFDSLAQLTASYHMMRVGPDFQADFEVSYLFLKSYTGSQGTFNSYRREVERLLQWCWHVQHLTLAQVRREEIETFIRFCQSPPVSWIGLYKVPRFIEVEGERQANPAWRPFVATLPKEDRKQGHAPEAKHFTLSQGAIAEIFAILSTFFNFLIAENYVTMNPVALIRQKSKFIRKRQQAAPIRRLSQVQWQHVLLVTEELAAQDPATHERTRFMFTLLFGLYLRISELAASERWSPCMNHFTKDSQGQWWFTTVGKGNKQRQIAVSDAMLASLMRWRTSLGMSPLPVVSDNSPLLPKVKGRGPLKDTAWIRRLVQRCFDLAAQRLREQHELEEAAALTVATVHWLRHTGISEDVKSRPREHVRDDAGHSSSAVTDRYIDVELAARHRSAKDKAI